MTVCIVSDARPEYAQAQQVIRTAPQGTVVVLSYQHRWVSPACALNKGMRLILACPNVEDTVTDVREADVLAVSVDDTHIRLVVCLDSMRYGGIYNNRTPQYFVQAVDTED